MLIIDFSQIVYKAKYAIDEDIIRNGVDNNVVQIKHRILNEILKLIKKFPDETEIVLCADSKKTNWRLEYHPYYKGRRKLRRNTDDFPYADFYKLLDIYIDELNEYSPFNVIRVDHTEGDDVIGTLVTYTNSIKPYENIIICSRDKDFKQLLISNNIKQYDIIKEEFLAPCIPANELMWLILKGDDADDILNVKTTDLDTFINPEKKQITNWRSNKIWEHINNNTVMDELLVDVIDKKTNKIIISREQLLENFNRNRKLVDLTLVPNKYKREILLKYKSNKKQNKTKKHIDFMHYLNRNNMIVMLEKIEDFRKYYRFLDKTSQSISDILDF